MIVNTYYCSVHCAMNRFFFCAKLNFHTLKD